MPETNKPVQDLIDLLVESSQVITERTEQDGTVTRSLDLDPEKLYWSTRMVNSDKFGRFVLVLKKFEQKAQECRNSMSAPRAKIVSDWILGMIKNYKYSIDGKSSESILDKNNKSGTLVHLISKNKQEKMYTVKGDMKKSFMAGLMGGEGDSERD